MLITRGTRGDVQPFVALARGTLCTLWRIGSASRPAAGKWHRVAENGELMWLVDDYGLKSQSCLHVASLFNALTVSNFKVVLNAAAG